MGVSLLRSGRANPRERRSLRSAKEALPFVGLFHDKARQGQATDLQGSRSWARQLVTLAWVSLGLRVPPSHHGLDVGNAPALPEESGSRRADSTHPGVALPAALQVTRSRLGSVIAIVGLGLLMVGTGDALGRTGHQSPVVPLFLAGLTFIFAPCAWRLTGTAATRNERVWVSVILGLGLLASYVFRSPLIFDNFDEMAHSATLTRLLDSRALFQPNPILSVSPYYPGIELTTIATRWLTGLPLLIDQMVVLVLTRIVVVLCVFLIVERACHSSRAGGIGVLVYAANPEFYSLGAQYGYQTLALAFAVAVVYLLFVSVDAAQPKRGRLFTLALISIAGMVVSHHVTAWLTVGFLVVWAAALRFVDLPGGRRHLALRTWRVHMPRLRLVTSSSRGEGSSRGSSALPLSPELFWLARGPRSSAMSSPGTSTRSFRQASEAPPRWSGSFTETESSSKTRPAAERRPGRKPSLWRRSSSSASSS